MRVRTQPLSVYLHWLGPAQLKGQEACYVAGANNGQLRVHSTGIAGAIGFVSVSPTDPRVMQNNRHPITDAGIGHMIDIYGQRWELERRLGKTTVHVGEFQYNQKRCARVELIRPDNRGPRSMTPARCWREKIPSATAILSRSISVAACSNSGVLRMRWSSSRTSTSW